MMSTYAAIFTIIVLRRNQRKKAVESLSMASQPFLIEKVVSFPSVRAGGAYEASGTAYLDIIHPDFPYQAADYPIIDTSDLVAIFGRCFVLLVVQKRSVKVVNESCDTSKNLGGC